MIAPLKAAALQRTANTAPQGATVISNKLKPTSAADTKFIATLTVSSCFEGLTETICLHNTALGHDTTVVVYTAMHRFT